MEFKDYYQRLGIERDAKEDEIKRSFRRLARKFHPDVSSEPDAEERFKEVQEAYEVLKDPEKRSAYDRFGENWKEGQDFRPPPDWQPDVGFSGGGYTEAGDFSDFFESMFGQAGHRRPGGAHANIQMKGEDLNARVAISIEDAYRGTTRSLSLQAPKLDEAGHVVMQPRNLNVKIPKGVTQGQRIRLAGQGGPGLAGAPNGDLYLEVVFEPHVTYHVDGHDVYIDLPVAPWEAALGRKVTVPTLGGKVDLKLPSNSQTGNRLRMKGRGLPGKQTGDQYVTLEVVVPKAETDEARALYEQMEREMAFDPRANLGV
jgi:curved DNA-binding protein